MFDNRYADEVIQDEINLYLDEISEHELEVALEYNLRNHDET